MAHPLDVATDIALHIHKTGERITAGDIAVLFPDWRTLTQQQRVITIDAVKQTAGINHGYAPPDGIWLTAKE